MGLTEMFKGDNQLYILCILLVLKYNVCSHIEGTFLSPP
uniref:Uncharacterized protein n=1 Tax=Anguilla anguilla TaxID=7936 RepID=A0A0E9W807_ANGAN